jgi:hypothetical protein
MAAVAAADAVRGDDGNSSGGVDSCSGGNIGSGDNKGSGPGGGTEGAGATEGASWHHTAPTPSLHTLQLFGLSISKVYSSLLCNATRTFQLHPTAPAFDLYSFLTLEDTYPVSM